MPFPFYSFKAVKNSIFACEGLKFKSIAAILSGLNETVLKKNQKNRSPQNKTLQIKNYRKNLQQVTTGQRINNLKMHLISERF